MANQPLKNKSKEINHAAKFPDELVEKILLNFSNENDIVYDPFFRHRHDSDCSQKIK